MSDETQLLLQLVRIWWNQLESADPFCPAWTVQGAAGSVMLLGRFSWHILSPVVPVEHRLHSTGGHVHPFMTAVNPFCDGYFQQDNRPCRKAQLTFNCFLEHDREFTLLKRPPQSTDQNSIEHLWSVVGSHHGCAAKTILQQLYDAFMSILAIFTE